jgi:hypothetical protein
MSFKSEAQRAKFAELLKDGKITKKTFDEWNDKTGKDKLPDRVHRNSKDYDAELIDADKNFKARFGVKK